MAAIAALSLGSKLALAATAVSTLMSAASQNKAATDAKNIANYNAGNQRLLSEYNAGLAEEAAGQEEAASQLRANEAKRQFRLRQSRVLALAAASGGGAMDVDVMNAIAGFEEEGDLAARTELYSGSDRASNLRAKGKAGIWEGETGARAITYEGLSKASALKNKAAATIMSGASSLAHKYGAYTDGWAKPTKKVKPKVKPKVVIPDDPWTDAY